MAPVMMVWAGMILVALLQIPSLVNQKMWKELAAFCAFWLFATVYASLITAGVHITNPTDILRAFFDWFYPLVGLNL